MSLVLDLSLSRTTEDSLAIDAGRYLINRDSSLVIDSLL